MDTKKYNTLIDGIKEKLGEEATSKIADDLAVLISDNNQVNNDLASKDEKINNLTKDKENLVKVNGNLLQQVAFGKEEQTIDEGEENKKETFSFKKQFNENGEFID